MAVTEPEAAQSQPEPPQAEPAPEAGSPISLNAVILVAACTALGAALALLPDAPKPLTFLFIAAAWIFTVVVHEFCHAFVAHIAGDTTVAAKGYLTLDPLKYTDARTSLLFPLLALALGGIGFPGGAVYLRNDLMRSRGWRSLASLAGPMGTLGVLLALAAAVALGRGDGIGNPLVQALAFLAFLQASALILNLLPFPGLDGFGVLQPFLPAATQAALRRIGGLAFLVLFGLIFFVPQASHLFFSGVLALTDALGVPRAAISDGWSAFRFWSTPGS